MAIELPEAVTLAGQMNEALSGKTIAEVHCGDNFDSLRRQGFTNLDTLELAGSCIERVSSKGKWIFIKLAPHDLHLLFTLETSGQILFCPTAATAPVKFSVRLQFTDGSSLSVRMTGWGFAKALPEVQIERERYPGKLPLSPIDPEFSFEVFNGILGSSTQRLKPFLVAQVNVAGLGNGYLQDVFFRARLHPNRRIVDLAANERSALYEAMTSTSAEAVRLGGRDTEVDLYGRPGSYRALMGRHMLGQPCPRCGTRVEKQRIGGSASYMCPHCQI